MKNLRVTVVGNEWKNDIKEKEMIRPLEEKDIDTVCGIVNENWKNVYSGSVGNVVFWRYGRCGYGRGI